MDARLRWAGVYNKPKQRTHAYINIGLNLNMINIYKFYHCPSLLATPEYELTTSGSQSGDANQSTIPPPNVCIFISI